MKTFKSIKIGFILSIFRNKISLLIMTDKNILGERREFYSY